MSNTKIVKTSKLVNSIEIDLKKYDSTKIFIEEYNLSKVVIDSDNSKTSSNEKKLLANFTSRPEKIAVLDINSAHQIKDNDNGVSKLYDSYIDSKSTRVVKWDKSITLTINKLEKVNVGL